MSCLRSAAVGRGNGGDRMSFARREISNASPAFAHARWTMRASPHRPGAPCSVMELGPSMGEIASSGAEPEQDTLSRRQSEESGPKRTWARLLLVTELSALLAGRRPCSCAADAGSEQRADLKSSGVVGVLCPLGLGPRHSQTCAKRCARQSAGGGKSQMYGWMDGSMDGRRPNARGRRYGRCGRGAKPHEAHGARAGHKGRRLPRHTTNRRRRQGLPPGRRRRRTPRRWNVRAVGGTPWCGRLPPLRWQRKLRGNVARSSQPSAEEQREVENARHVGGMWRPARAVAFVPGLGTVGTAIRRAFESFFDEWGSWRTRWAARATQASRTSSSPDGRKSSRNASPMARSSSPSPRRGSNPRCVAPCWMSTLR